MANGNVTYNTTISVTDSAGIAHVPPVFATTHAVNIDEVFESTLLIPVATAVRIWDTAETDPRPMPGGTNAVLGFICLCATTMEDAVDIMEVEITTTADVQHLQLMQGKPLVLTSGRSRTGGMAGDFAGSLANILSIKLKNQSAGTAAQVYVMLCGVAS